MVPDVLDERLRGAANETKPAVPPVKRANLIDENGTPDRNVVRERDFGRPFAEIACDWADDGVVGGPIVIGLGDHQSRSLSGLLGSFDRVEINPNDISAFRA